MRRYNKLVQIRAVDPSTAPEADLRAQYELFSLVESEAMPDDDLQPWAEWQAWIRISPPTRKTFAWHAYDEAGLAGFAYLLFWEAETNQRQATFWIDVRPDARRQRIGSRLFEALVETAQGHGRTLLDASARPRIAGSEAFAESLGGRAAFTGRTNVLRIADLDLGLMHEWVDRAKERAADYALEWLESPVRESRVDALVAAHHIMNTAPSEDFETEDEVFTVADYRANEATYAARESDQWTLAAVHEPTGAIAGYTEVQLPSLWPERAYQGDTGVDPAHRDRGLGRWLKAAMVLRILDERPAVQSIRTGNAASNAPMLNINDAMGFRCVEEHPIYQIDICGR